MTPTYGKLHNTVIYKHKTYSKLHTPFKIFIPLLYPTFTLAETKVKTQSNDAMN